MMKLPEDQQDRRAYHKPHAALRTDGYVLLGALLREPPSKNMKNIVSNLRWDDNLPQELCAALSALRQCGANLSLEAMGEEFHRLFVGLGSGELIPYGSWYLEKAIQSAPLAAIRADLNRFGLIRQSWSFESEDHAGALCEIMALLSSLENRVLESEQTLFFRSHVDAWMPHFFSDLAAAENCRFYRLVGDFGGRFLEGERTYLNSASPLRVDAVTFDTQPIPDRSIP